MSELSPVAHLILMVLADSEDSRRSFSPELIPELNELSRRGYVVPLPSVVDDLQGIALTYAGQQRVLEADFQDAIGPFEMKKMTHSDWMTLVILNDAPDGTPYGEYCLAAGELTPAAVHKVQKGPQVSEWAARRLVYWGFVRMTPEVARITGAGYELLQKRGLR